MTAQDLIFGARVAHLRELKTELAELRAQNARLHEELASLKSHFDVALLAVEDLRVGELEIWDGWNLVLGTKKVAHDRAELVAQAEATGRRIWIVFDGPNERIETKGLVRVSFTGGTGAHRADRFILDFLRAAAYLGLAARVNVRTDDRDFQREVRRIREKCGIISTKDT